MNGCKRLKPFDGQNWSTFKFRFTILCRSFKLQGFIEDPYPWGYGYAFPANEPDLIPDYIACATAVFTGIHDSVTEVVKYKIKPFADGYYPAAETWKFLQAEYSSDQNLGLNDLIHQMQTLRMDPGDFEAYVSKKLQLRDELYALNYPLPKLSFNEYLVQGLPEEWHTNVNLFEKSDTNTLGGTCDSLHPG